MRRPPSLGFCLTGLGSFEKLGNLKFGFLSVGDSGCLMVRVEDVSDLAVETEGPPYPLDTPEMYEAVLA